MSYMSKFVTSIVVLLLMAVVVSRQLFLFILSEPAAPTSHLWLAVVAGITACAAGALMFYFFSRHQNNQWSKVELTPGEPLLDLFSLTAPALPPAKFDAARWAVANPWLTEGQPDDRPSMDGSARNIGGTPSEQRAFTRRTHQLMFKKWSQTRHY